MTGRDEAPLHVRQATLSLDQQATLDRVHLFEARRALRSSAASPERRTTSYRLRCIAAARVSQGLLDRGKPRLDQRREHIDPLDLLGIVGDQRAQLLQLVVDRRDCTARYGSEENGSSGEQIAALTGLGAAQVVSEQLRDRVLHFERVHDQPSASRALS